MTAKFWFQVNAALACLWILFASGWWNCPSGGDVVAYGIFAILIFLVAVITFFIGLIVGYVKHQSIKTWAATALALWLCVLAIDFGMIRFDSRPCYETGGYVTP